MNLQGRCRGFSLIEILVVIVIVVIVIAVQLLQLPKLHAAIRLSPVNEGRHTSENLLFAVSTRLGLYYTLTVTLQ